MTSVDEAVAVMEKARVEILDLRATLADLVSAATCANNVLFLLDTEVKNLGFRAHNVPEKLRAAIQKAEKML